MHAYITSSISTIAVAACIALAALALLVNS